MLSEQPVLGTRGMVATAHYLATHASLQVLTQGCNALDAALAANAAMTVVYPAMCTAGGDLFVLVWEARMRQLYALNGSGRAQRTMHTLTPTMVLHDSTPRITLGSMGGDAQPQIHVQLLSAMIDFERNVQQAVSAPRWRSGRFQIAQGAIRTELSGQAGVDAHPARHIVEGVHLENRISAQVALGLDLPGHRTTLTGPWEDGMGHAQGNCHSPGDAYFRGGCRPALRWFSAWLVAFVVDRVSRSQEGRKV